MFKLRGGKIERRTSEISRDVPRICIVTPVYNGGTYIDDTIYSVLSQSGDFVLHYHIQDGGSTDDTVERVERWLRDSHKFPKLCRELVFTFSTAPDDGMYDAINAGFAAALPPGDDVVMGWIAADDRIAPGAFSTICNIRAQYSDIRFLGGRISLLDQSGGIIGIHSLMPFSQRCMAAGLYDGRSMPFIMQEGTFWCADLWHRIGGLDASFRLAGDWDLWRRMAAHANYVSADTILGFHRRRPGQLSEQMDRYYKEVDEALDKEALLPLPAVLAEPILEAGSAADGTSRQIAEAIHREFEVLKTRPADFRESSHASTVVKFNLEHRRWDRLSGFGAEAGAPELITPAGTTAGYAVLLTSGFRAAEGPHPDLGLMGSVRWMNGPIAEGEVDLPEPGTYRVVILCRSFTQGQRVTILANGKPLGLLVIVPHGNDRDIELSVDGVFGSGPQLISISVEQPSHTNPYLLVIEWSIRQLMRAERETVLPVPLAPAPLATLAGRPPRGEWPTISIVVPTRNQAHFITDTLNSIIRQGYPNLELIVVDGSSTDETPQILRSFAGYMTHLIAEPDDGQSNAINKGFRVSSGEILGWLNSDDLLADGALYAIAHAFMASDADMVAGVCNVFDIGNRTLHRHLPCLSDGPLPLANLLDIENRWLRGQFFHQPEVFFTRRIWERLGSSVDEDLFYSMDYDLWVKMARYDARISVIGADVAHYRMHAEQKTSTVEAYRPELTAHASLLRQQVGIPAMPKPRELKHRLKIVFFNDYGFKYGAGIAHARLAAALSAVGHEIVALAYADFDLGAPVRDMTASEVAEAILATQPDLIVIGNLHSIAPDFDLLGELIPTGIPTIFYAHDQWLGTGRCPYSGGDCSQRETLCGKACVSIAKHSGGGGKKIAPMFQIKRSAIADTPTRRFAVLTNSRYMQDFLGDALDSPSKPPIHVAPIGIDTKVFKIADRWRARMLLDLPQNAFIIMTAAANVTDERKGLSILLDAMKMMTDKKDVILLIMGFGEENPDMSIDVRYTGYLNEEDAIALRYQAADVFIGPSRAEAFGQTYIEAAACGVPSIAFNVGGVSDAILNELTGLLVDEVTPQALNAGIERLRQNLALRRQMGVQARLHVVNRYSLEASAAKFSSILVEESALDFALAPSVVLQDTMQSPLTVRYLIEPQESAGQRLQLEWFPHKNLFEEQPDEKFDLPPRVWWGMWPRSQFIVRAQKDGPHTLQMSVHNEHFQNSVTVTVNNGSPQIIKLKGYDFHTPEMLRLPVNLVRGLNRVDVHFSAVRREKGPGGRALSLLFSEISLWPGAFREGASKDGASEMIEGFDAPEGPYLEAGLPNRFSWALGPRSKVQIFSAFSGSRVLEMKFRNTHNDQRFTIMVDDATVLSQVVNATGMTTLATLRFEAYLTSGFHVVTIDSLKQLEGAADNRRLAFAFEGLRLCPLGEDLDPVEDAIRWDLSTGAGPEESSDPADNLPATFRWFKAAKVSVVIDRREQGDALLEINYRSPVKGQLALVRVNGQKSGQMEFPNANLSDTARVEHRVTLNSGQNVVELEFQTALKRREGEFDLFLLVENLTIAEAGKPLVAKMPSLAAPLQWNCLSGFSWLEEPNGENGLFRPFRWALEGENRIGLTQPASHLTLFVRNNMTDQALDIFTNKSEFVRTALLTADLMELQEVTVDLSDFLANGLVIRPQVTGAVSVEEPRHLCYILEAISVEAGEPLRIY